MFTWEEIAALLQVIGENTVSLLSGIFGLVITGLGLTWPGAPQRKVWIVLGLVAVFLSPILAWRDEHRRLRLLQERLSSPELRGEFSKVASGRNGQDVIISLDGFIENPLGPPSAVVGWEIRLEFPDSRMIVGEFMPFTGVDMKAQILGSPLTLTMPSGNYWPHRASQPIPAGGVVEGWLAAVFRNVKEEEIYGKNVTLVVSFKDVVAGKQHSIRQVLKKPGVEVPGLLTPPADVSN